MGYFLTLYISISLSINWILQFDFFYLFLYVVAVYVKGAFLYLFVWGFSLHSRIFHSYGDVTITGEGLQVLTYARHSWPISSEGSLACHPYCDTWQPFILSSSKTCVTLTYCRTFGSGAVTTLGLFRLVFEHPTFRFRSERFNPLRHAAAFL